MEIGRYDANGVLVVTGRNEAPPITVRPPPTPAPGRPYVLSVENEPVYLGEMATFKLAPEDQVIESLNTFTFDFGDGSPSQVMQKGSNEIRHFYREADIFGVSVDVSIPRVVNGNRAAAPVINKVKVLIRHFKLKAEPTAADVNEPVTFRVDPDSNDKTIEYSFDFGDGSPKTRWQIEPYAEHKYETAKEYTASVEIRNRDANGRNFSDVVEADPITVSEAEPATPTITPETPSPTRVIDDPTFPPWWFIPLIIVLLVGIAAASGVLIYQAGRSIYTSWNPPRPTFQPFPDSGDSFVKPGTRLTFNAQLRLNANTSAGQYQLLAEEARLIKTARRKHV
ncbi:MAG: PKD domain-containing protein [Acidobacteriota bacterium]|nr:PKD domain-containing protein [Acidobacteriota bacterium]